MEDFIAMCSKLALGTAQLSHQYGIAHSGITPNEARSIGILQTALNGGVTLIDTAPAYDSEPVIGSFMNAHPSAKEQFEICSKIGGLASQHDRTSFFQSSLETSTERLQVEKLDFCLLHNSSDLCLGGVVLDRLFNSCSEFVECFGVSVYTAEEIEICLSIDSVRAIQIPFSICDTRLLRSGLLERAHSQGIIIMARSVFLQGLLMMSSVPQYLTVFNAVCDMLDEYAVKFNMTRAELAYCFVRDCPYIDYVVVGADSSEQLGENIRFDGMPTLPSDCWNDLVETSWLQSADEWILDPRNWKRR